MRRRRRRRRRRRLVLLPTRALGPARHALGALAAAVQCEALLAARKLGAECERGCGGGRGAARRGDLLRVLPACDILPPGGMVACRN
jgi:hypothetical protein